MYLKQNKHTLKYTGVNTQTGEKKSEYIPSDKPTDGSTPLPFSTEGRSCLV